MIFRPVTLLALLGSLTFNADAASGSLRNLKQDACKPVDTVDDFDLETYVSKPWYIHQQAEIQFNPIEQNFCARARYTIREDRTFWGYTVNVDNYAQDKDGNEFGGPLCAFQEDEKASKLRVAPCNLPKIAAGPYWIVAYDEDAGYALVSGGQPTIPSDDGPDAGCRAGTGVNNSGLWILLRNSTRDDSLVTTVRQIAKDKGFDLSILNDVNQEGCFVDEEDVANDMVDEDVAPPTNNDPACEEDSQDTFSTVFFGEQDCAWVAEGSFLRCFVYSRKCPRTCGRGGCHPDATSEEDADETP